MAKILAADDSWGGARWADVSSFLEERVEFVLLHEFAAADGFGWHVDATPNDVLDDKHRFLNVNVVLSDPGDYDGGALQVGATNVSLGRGDLHVYRASTPHRVYEITRGVRRTLVVATKFGGDRFGLRDGPRGRRPFDPTSADRTLRPRFERLTSAIDSSKHQPHRRRCDRARDVRRPGSTVDVRAGTSRT